MISAIILPLMPPFRNADFFKMINTFLKPILVRYTNNYRLKKLNLLYEIFCIISIGLFVISIELIIYVFQLLNRGRYSRKSEFIKKCYR